jgi:hypothetical protein
MKSEVLKSVNVKTGVLSSTWHLIPGDYSLNYWIRNNPSHSNKVQ